MEIAFRADSSPRIGSGHIFRCLTLADALSEQGHHCRFICRDHPGGLHQTISRKGYSVQLLSTPERMQFPGDIGSAPPHADWLGVPWQVDAKQTVALLQEAPVDWLVVDHYAIDSRWESMVSPVFKRALIIDDLADRSHHCDLLLDQNLGRQSTDYDGLVPEHCIRLIGPSHALLRQEFQELRKASLARREQPRLKRILISLGGVDNDNVTESILRTLATSELPYDTRLDIVMGATSPHLERVRNHVEQSPFEATLSVNVNDMARRMSLADIAIGAAGTTAWERCCLGLPSIIVVLAENQRSGALALQKNSAAIVIGEPKDIDTTLPLAIANLSDPSVIRRMSEAAAAVTSGLGSRKVVPLLTRDTEQR